MNKFDIGLAANTVYPPYYYEDPGRFRRPREGKVRRPRKSKDPRTVRELIASIRRNEDLNAGMKMLKERRGEFPDSLAMDLVGIALHGKARAHFDDQLDRMWGKSKLPKQADELIVGAGFHAAVYASVRVANGFPKPLVVEATDRVGGAFAVSRNPSFYLNSRNRPGELGVPGRGEALNVLPAGPVQPSMLSGADYQRNSDLAFAIRCALAMNARVVTGVSMRLGQVAARKVYFEELEDGRSSIQANRLIYATGLGAQSKPSDSDRLMTFAEFMAQMDRPYPLRGMRRVAVVGAGDSGKTAIEALTGRAPATGMSVAALDWPERIDWYGISADRITPDDWKACNRGRYQGIASSLGGRVQPIVERARQVASTYDGVVVNGRKYDHVIWCTGYSADAEVSFLPTRQVDGRNVARFASAHTYTIGPAAQIDMDPYEVNALPAGLPENAVALFRYADRTALLADELGTPEEPPA